MILARPHLRGPQGSAGTHAFGAESRCKIGIGATAQPKKLKGLINYGPGYRN
jgi:hypothetical protein